MVQTVNNIGKQSDAENLMIHLLLRFEARAALLKETAKKVLDQLLVCGIGYL